jgi:N-acetyl sugar amidotransferase
MDTSDPKITFDANGICTHCRRYAIAEAGYERAGTWSAENLAQIVENIRAVGRTGTHDVLMGLSGGVDSSYLALLAHQFGFRAICVHLDNGWNSELAVTNIENVIRRYGFTLHTHVIDWEEFRDLQLSFLKASVVDVEMLTDHAIGALMHQVAAQQGIKHILIGTNFASEAFMPYSWFYGYKHDLLNLLAIHHQFGTRRLKSFPTIDPYRRWEYDEVHGIRSVSLLNYVGYNPLVAREVLRREQGWRPYPRKHCESVFTQWYQEVFLPQKFGIDKRRVHFSNLVCSRILTREQAVAELAENEIKPAEAEELTRYVCKKLGLSDEEFRRLMALPRREHHEYAAGYPPPR